VPEESTTDTVDPVASSGAYQQLLLSLLGEDDPAEVQAASPAAVRALIAEAGNLVRERPEPTEWSVLECLGHLVDGELIVAARYRWIVSEDEPDIVGYDQALWVDRLRHGNADPAALLALFETVRRANLDLWTHLPVADRDRIGRHRERGPESYGLTFRLAAGHDRLHLAQAGRALEAVRRGS
jgi:DinB family protein